jgi:glycosyltransferase involved in cell wall biosynthesis
MSFQSSSINHQSSTDLVKATRLLQLVRITEQVWPEGTVPVVSVFCITYNHVNFIRDAIEGFLMQETTFPVEIFIHDDASTDGTSEIVREYAEKYPKLFRTILQTENQWSKGNVNLYFAKLIQEQRGEFIALCEGDDYWIAKEKLQKQVEVLEANHEISLVFHNCWVKHELSHNDYFKNRGFAEGPIDYPRILSSGWFIGTASMLFRQKDSILPPEMTYSIGGDLPLQLMLATKGNFYFIDSVYCVYRRHIGGMSDVFWERGEYFREILLPNRVWLYWIYMVKNAPAKYRDNVLFCIRKFIREMAESFVKVNNADAYSVPSFVEINNRILALLEKAQPFDFQIPITEGYLIFKKFSEEEVHEVCRRECDLKLNRIGKKSFFDATGFIKRAMFFKTLTNKQLIKRLIKALAIRIR